MVVLMIPGAYAFTVILCFASSSAVCSVSTASYVHTKQARWRVLTGTLRHAPDTELRGGIRGSAAVHAYEPVSGREFPMKDIWNMT